MNSVSEPYHQPDPECPQHLIPLRSLMHALITLLVLSIPGGFSDHTQNSQQTGPRHSVYASHD